MRKIILISCASKKKDNKTSAENLYESPLFNNSLKYAKLLNPDRIFILSAFHGLLELNEEIFPYDKTLNEMDMKKRFEWGKKVITELEKKGLDLKKDHFIFLAGKKYRENIIKSLANYEIPLEGMRIGEQLAFLKKRVNQNEQDLS